ncbi:MAG TPA: selenocysteine-specific translation elongation factor [Candidatus Eisenbacteria bacterium]|nr:selenocysteine-specific translation elongation factor [Candidatus Eisenbacteria bacterium]
MPYIIGTAGHIDHGKTSLVKALTGQDTDRLKEEKERGISIDLGFAHFDLPDGTQAGVVDVPGHERFIRNMLAGAHGIDLVLFTVAADDGVMPQTEEHLDIVHLLGVRMAIFVITKADLVDQARIAEVEEEIKILTLGTLLENAPIVSVSSATGAGVAELKALIGETLRRCEKPAPTGYFRLPVDRAFVLQGHGVVVTGTALSGQVQIGERVRCLPGDQLFRVRSIQVHGRSVERAGWGQRVALNLTGPDRAEIVRGHVICHEKLQLASDRIDAFIEVRPGAGKGIKSHQRVRLHLGTAERLAKLILLGTKEAMLPKDAGYCQLALSEPLQALRGDHLIVRDETGRRTLGGGVVVHPWAKRHRKTEPDLVLRLQRLHHGAPTELAHALIEESEAFALPIHAIYQFLNLTEREAGGLVEQMAGLRALTAEGERVYTTEHKWLKLRESVMGTLKDFHASHPLVPGMDMEELRGKLPFGLTPKTFRAAIELLSGEGVIAKEENLLRLATHRIQLGSQDRSAMAKIKAILGAQPMAPPDLKDLEKQLGIGRAKLAEVLRLLEREGAVVRVTSDLYFLAGAVEEVRRILRENLLVRGEITAAGFRDLLGSSRKYTIALLEYFDREGLTMRVGDLRRLRSNVAGREGAAR